MIRWQRLRQLRLTDWRLLGTTITTVVLVRVALSLLPYKVVRRLLARLAARPLRLTVAPARIAWAVSGCSRCVPWATCLTQALAGETLLRRAGHTSVVHIGVALGELGKLKAHAWLECQGRILLGGGARTAFTPLPPLDTPS